MWRVNNSKNILKYYFSKKQQISVEEIRNNNLRFQADKWIIHLFPFYPQIYKKKMKNTYEIGNTTVLAMTFINSTVADDVGWANRKSLTFKFKQLTQMMNLQIGSGQKIAIQTVNVYKQNTRSKVLTLEDIKKEKNIKFNLQSLKQKSRDALSERNKDLEWELQAKLPYTEYRVMYKLIESSLFDLSGWRLMLQLQKKQQLQKIQGNLSTNKQFQQLINQ